MYKMMINQSEEKDVLTNPDEICTSQLKTISQDPPFPLDVREFLKVCKMLLTSSIPISLSNFSTLITGVISLGFVGNYGTSAELAGASLANTWGFGFYFGVCNCFNVGFQVVAAQLHGANKYKQLAQAFQKNLFIIALLSIPLLLLVNAVNRFSALFEADGNISSSSQTYLNYLTPSLIINSFSDCTMSYLIGQNYFYPQGIIQGIAAILHFFWCYLFVVVFDMPLIGTAIAKGITDLTIISGLVLFLYKDKLTDIIIQYWNKQSLEGWQAHLKQVIMIGGNVYVQWAIFGIIGFMIGMLADETVIGAHGLASLFIATLFTISVGNSLTMQSYLGNAIGGGWKFRAQKVMMSSFSINFCVSILNVCFMVFGNEFLADLLTSDPETKEMFKTILYIYSTFHIGDTFADHMACVLRTLGWEQYVLLISITGYLVIGISLQWILGFTLEFGCPGMWVATGLQVLFLFCSFLIKVVRLDWDNSVQIVGQKIGTEKYTEIELENVNN